MAAEAHDDTGETAPCSGTRVRHRPESTVLYPIVAEHLETFLAEAREAYDRPLPDYVEQEFRSYLECGIPSFGFSIAECRHCQHRIIVAFSCQKRGACPSCNARRMCDSAAHLVDRVFPDVPVRQWVLSVPFELRLLLLRNADAYGAVTRIFMEEIARWQKEQARVLGLDVARVRGAGIAAHQRFGGALNANPHVHAVLADGVFALPGSTPGRADFHRLPAPLGPDAHDVAMNTHYRFLRWLRNRDLLHDDDAGTPSADEPTAALDSLQNGALGVGQLTHLDRGADRSPAGKAQDRDEHRFGRSKSRHAAEFEGWSVHAAVNVRADDFEGRERLLRYCLRPPFSLERLSVLPDGRVAYELRRPWRKDQTHRVMTKTELLARIAAIIPPPRRPLIRFFGAFAPNSPWRSAVVPFQAAQPCTRVASDRMCTSPVSTHGLDRNTDEGQAGVADGETPAPSQTAAAPPVICALPAATLLVPATDERARHAALPWRLDWATLLRRTYDVDALACPRCGGRLWFVELLELPHRARERLRDLGLPDEPPPLARARAPDIELDLPFDDVVNPPPRDDVETPPPDYFEGY